MRIKNLFQKLVQTFPCSSSRKVWSWVRHPMQINLKFSNAHMYIYHFNPCWSTISSFLLSTLPITLLLLGFWKNSFHYLLTYSRFVEWMNEWMYESKSSIHVDDVTAIHGVKKKNLFFSFSFFGCLFTSNIWGSCLLANNTLYKELPLNGTREYSCHDPSAINTRSKHVV